MQRERWGKEGRAEGEEAGGREGTARTAGVPCLLAPRMKVWWDPSHVTTQRDRGRLYVCVIGGPPRVPPGRHVPQECHYMGGGGREEGGWERILWIRSWRGLASYCARGFPPFAILTSLCTFRNSDLPWTRRISSPCYYVENSKEHEFYLNPLDS